MGTALAEAIRDARVLLMSGGPIGEPIVSYGPFVMNTEDEIRQAFATTEAAMGTIESPAA
jgi:redox-sensitive bicupin YhaK (pirin superfamily)